VGILTSHAGVTVKVDHYCYDERSLTIYNAHGVLCHGGMYATED
jgi:hypothetical protein